MNRQKAVAIPIVIVFMVLSQLLYLSLLHFNRVQMQRYQGLIEYYHQQIQLEVSEYLLDLPPVASQIEKQVEQAIQYQERTFVRPLSTWRSEYNEPQIKIWSDYDKVIVVVHQVFLDEQYLLNPQNVARHEASPYVIDGLLLANKSMKLFDDAFIQQQYNTHDQNLQRQQWHLASQKSRTYAQVAHAEGSLVQQIVFDSGEVAIQQQGDNVIMTANPFHSTRRYQRKIALESVAYVVLTTIYYYSQS